MSVYEIISLVIQVIRLIIDLFKSLPKKKNQE